jgi:hypothetical protein
MMNLSFTIYNQRKKKSEDIQIEYWVVMLVTPKSEYICCKALTTEGETMKSSCPE